MTSNIMLLDTVELVIPLPYRMTSYVYPFEGPEWIHTEAYGYSTLTFKATKRFRECQAEYIPTIKYRERRMPDGLVFHELLVEVSIPKMLFGNNFIDARKDGLGTFYDRLQSSISGVYGFKKVDEYMIKRATLKRMDCGSRVAFKDISSYNLAKSRLLSAVTDKRVDVDAPQYSTKGLGVSISCGSWQFVLYNKNEELKRYASSPRKAKYESNDDIMVLNKSFFNMIKNAEVVVGQFEFRLNGKKYINEALGLIGEPRGSITLEEALDKDIPRRIAAYYWQRILDGLPRIDLVEASEDDIVNKFASAYETPANLAKAIGYAIMSKAPDQESLRRTLEWRGGRSAWTRYQRTVKNLPRLKIKGGDPIQPISDKIFGITEMTNSEKRTLLAMKHVAKVLIFCSISITMNNCIKNSTTYISLCFSCCLAHRCTLRTRTRAPPGALGRVGNVAPMLVY